MGRPKNEALSDIDRVERRKKVKYSCPVCGSNAWGKPALELVCGVCSHKYVEWQGKKVKPDWEESESVSYLDGYVDPDGGW
jgi:transcription elongation factor Elf1